MALAAEGTRPSLPRHHKPHDSSGLAVACCLPRVAVPVIWLSAAVMVRDGRDGGRVEP